MKKNKGSVLLVSEYFLPHWTGISQAFFYLTKNLQDQGFTTTVLTTQFDTKLPLKEEIRGVDIIRSPFQFQISRTHYSWRILIDFISLLPRYDWVVINSPNSNILFYSLLTKIYRKKLAIYHQGDLTLPRQTGNLFTHLIMEKLFDILSIPSFLMADIISSYTRDYAEHSRVMRHNLKSFRAYIPSFTIQKGKPSPDFRKKILTLKKKHVLIGIAGRFVEEKGYDILLEAIDRIKKEVPSAHIVFAGKHKMDYEPYFDFHKKLIGAHKNDITFLGLLGPGDLSLFYSHLDVFVLSSRSDCFPVTQIEVVVHGIPIVVTNIPGARMLVKETGFGLLAKPEDADDVSEKIVEVLKHKKKYIQAQKKALQFLGTYETFRLD